jgi:GT2 family glycosyltransferase
MTFTIDVVIPVFNGERTILRAIRSVLSQRTEHTIRLFCVDDFSTDRSLAVMSDFAAQHPEIVITRHDENRGVAAARNLGASLGTGQIICFLDHDDEWVSDKITWQIALFVDDPTVEYSTGLQQMIIEVGYDRPTWCRPEWLHGPIDGSLPSTLMLRRALWERIGGFDTSFQSGSDDVEWFARARRLKTRHQAVPRVLLQHYVHGANLSGAGMTGAQELLAIARQHIQQSREA